MHSKNTKNSSTEDTAYIIQRVTEQSQVNVQTKTDERKVLRSGTELQWIVVQWNVKLRLFIESTASIRDSKRIFPELAQQSLQCAYWVLQLRLHAKLTAFVFDVITVGSRPKVSTVSKIWGVSFQEEICVKNTVWGMKFLAPLQVGVCSMLIKFIVLPPVMKLSTLLKTVSNDAFLCLE